ncbi:hypothetical protein L6241_04700 [Janibacter sp. Y6]|uniref:arsenate reductase/protein-tyrosine-phosphatase family protein n=1 Tax=Janibacter sp. Y6 TaxID=2913552 RepID=UPI0034A30A8F
MPAQTRAQVLDGLSDLADLTQDGRWVKTPQSASSQRCARTVCTGNICRSPYAHLLLAQGLKSVRPGAFEVSSTGVGALVDHSVESGSARHLDAKGITHTDIRARQISEGDLDWIDLMLPMTVEHRKAVLSYAPRLLKRAYTIKEIARLIDSAEQPQPWTGRLAGLETPEERWAAIPTHLARERGRARVAEGVDDVRPVPPEGRCLRRDGPGDRLRGGARRVAGACYGLILDLGWHKPH